MSKNKTFSRSMSELLHKPYKRIDTRRSHGRSGKMHTKFQHKHFVCWDGEGIEHPLRPTYIYCTPDGTIHEKVEYQIYALLMNNEGVIKSDMQGLSTLTCLETLMNSTDDKRAIHVCFGSSYDTNMMLRDIPVHDLRILHSGKAIDYKQYRIAYRPRKTLEIWEYATPNQKFIQDEKTKKWKRWYKKSLILWDVFGFFQCSFIEALDKYFMRGNQLPEVKNKYKRIIDQIKEGKDRRGTFTEHEMSDFIIPYCKLEVDALCELMQELHSHLDEIGMRINRWDGAGACATSMLQTYAVKSHIDESMIPEEAVVASEYAFFGGHIEVYKYGNYEGNVYHADINSAYPDALRELPSFIKGTWFHTDQQVRPGLLTLAIAPEVSLFLISWVMPEKSTICPFPWRDKVGNVFFPPYGKAWVYKPELEMALQCFPDCDIMIHERWEYHPGTDSKPYAFIPDVYEFRKYLISIGSGAEKEIKLALNSLYGKSAQSIGYATDRGIGKPPYHNLFIAGMTTSKVRAKLMRVAMQHPSDVIMLATDGIYSTHDMEVMGKTSIEKKLGEWEYALHQYITIVASGVYWYKSDDKDENAFSRGFNKYSIMRDMVLNAWRNHEKELLCDTTRFVGLGSAIGLNNFDVWCTWRTINRALGLNMDKVAKRIDSSSSVNLADGLRSTYAAIPKQLAHFDSRYIHDSGGFALSHKYEFAWDDDKKRNDMLDGLPMRVYLEEVANSRS